MLAYKLFEKADKVKFIKNPFAPKRNKVAMIAILQLEVPVVKTFSIDEKLVLFREVFDDFLKKVFIGSKMFLVGFDKEFQQDDISDLKALFIKEIEQALTQKGRFECLEFDPDPLHKHALRHYLSIRVLSTLDETDTKQEACIRFASSLSRRFNKVTKVTMLRSFGVYAHRFLNKKALTKATE